MRSIPINRVVLYVALLTSTAAADLISKEIIFRRYGIHTGSDWILNGWLKFRLFTSLNEGALWGIGQGFALGFAALSVVALIGIWYWLFARRACENLLLTVALGLVSGGTIGNLYDRLGLAGIRDATGRPVLAVRDFMDVRLGSFDWAIFNVADACLVCGAIMLLIQSFRMPADVPLPVAE